jgi:hypothetical protein
MVVSLYETIRHLAFAGLTDPAKAFSQFTFERLPALACIAAQTLASGQPASIQAATSARRHNRLRPNFTLGGNFPAAAKVCQWDRLQPHRAAAAVSGISNGAKGMGCVVIELARVSSRLSSHIGHLAFSRESNLDLVPSFQFTTRNGLQEPVAGALRRNQDRKQDRRVRSVELFAFRVSVRHFFASYPSRVRSAKWGGNGAKWRELMAQKCKKDGFRRAEPSHQKKTIES